MKTRIILMILTNKKVLKIVLTAVLIPIFLVLGILASPFAIFFSVFDDKEAVSAYDYINTLSLEFKNQIEEEIDDETADKYKVIYRGSDANTMIDNSSDVLMVYSVLANERDKKQVLKLNSADMKKLRDKYFQMNYIKTSYKEKEKTRYKKETVIDKKTGKKTKITIKETYTITIKNIYVTSLSADDMKRIDRFSKKEIEILDNLISSEYASNFYMNGLSDEKIREIRSKIGNRKITGEDVVNMAMSLEGKVKYFWGGKYFKKGICQNWGKPMKVTSPGSSTTGKVKPYGLDCSGYVTWVFINLDVPLEVIGNGARNQNAKCIPVNKDTVRAGDFAFLTPTGREHIGIVTGFDTDGEILVIHESAGINNVAISRASDIGFKYFKRHAILLDLD